MNRRTRVLWVPALASIVFTVAWFVLTFRTLYVARALTAVISDPERLEDPVFAMLLIHSPLILAGAVGAFLSWRSGGSAWERIAAGGTPVVAFLVAAQLAGFIGGMTANPWGVVLLPALYALLGVLPFLFPGPPSARRA